MNLGPSEIFVVLLVIMLLFGGKRLPEIARNLGRGLAEIRRVTIDMKRELNSTISDSPRRSPNVSEEKKSEPETPAPKVHANPASQPRTPPPPSGSDS